MDRKEVILSRIPVSGSVEVDEVKEYIYTTGKVLKAMQEFCDECQSANMERIRKLEAEVKELQDKLDDIWPHDNRERMGT